QHELVHQLGREQRAHHRQAAIHVNVAARLETHRRHLAEEVSATDERRRLPYEIRRGERVRHNVFLDTVDPVGERVATAFGPRRCRDQIRATTLQQCLASLPDLADDRPHDFGAKELPRPATVAESAARVLLRTAWRLYDAVKTHEFADEDSHSTLL